MKVRFYGGRFTAANMQTQTNAGAHRRTETNARHAQTNARQTVSGVWADPTSRQVQTLDVCSKTFGMYYSLFAVVFLTQGQRLVNSLQFR